MVAHYWMVCFVKHISSLVLPEEDPSESNVAKSIIKFCAFKD